MAAALTDLHAALLGTFVARDAHDFMPLSERLDTFSQVTFIPPMEGYIRRMLWALAADGVIPDDACDDPWGPPWTPVERDRVRRAVREAREDS